MKPCYGESKVGVFMGYKQERLEKAIERELGNILLSEIKDDRLKYVTFTKSFVNRRFIDCDCLLYRARNRGTKRSHL